MHAAKRPNSTKIKSAKTFLKAFPRKFIPSKYTRYTVEALLALQHCSYSSLHRQTETVYLTAHAQPRHNYSWAQEVMWSSMGSSLLVIITRGTRGRPRVE